MRRAALALCGLLAAAGDAGASGYSLYEQGARALGMAGAFTARADDPSSMFFNPAGLAQVQGQALLVSPNAIFFRSEFAGTAPSPGYGVVEKTEDKAFFPLALYYARNQGQLAGGIGMYNSYGLEVEWASPDTYTGRFISTRSKVRPFYFVPTLAYALNDRLRIGAGANLVFSKVELERHVPAFDPFTGETVDVGTAALASETDFGAGWNAGVQWQPGARVRVGASYRSKVSVDYNGRADFTQRASGDPQFDPIVAAAFPPDQAITTSVPFPAQGSLGVSYEPCGSWAFEGDFNWTWWDAFETLDVHFVTTPALDFEAVQDWKGVMNIRFGTEYHPGAWSYRAGYYYDRTPQPRASLGPLLPDADRHGITLGLGHRWSRTTVDAFALGVIAPDRSTEGTNRDGYDGTYSNRTFTLGASLGVAWP
jgi:long-chain fatty acid transport protein